VNTFGEIGHLSDSSADGLSLSKPVGKKNHQLAIYPSTIQKQKHFLQ
jgi:hypothetical protein